jgi:predicted RNA-binding protein with PUA-like domain
MAAWLMKSEPDEFSIADLARVGVEPWSGVRSVFARFHMRQMAVGDDVLFYHSSAAPPGVAGLARVARTGIVDETQFDPASPYYDAKATRDKPIWDCVEVAYVSTLPHFVTLDRMRRERALRGMILFRQGRLSVQPVSAPQFAKIVELAQTPEPVRARPKARAKRTRAKRRR